MKAKSKKLSVVQGQWLAIFFLVLISCAMLVLVPGCGGGDEGGSDTGTPGNGGGSGGSPSVTIHSPSSNQILEKGAAINFNGTALDPEDGNLSGNSLVWSSSQDGQIGTGSSPNVVLLSIGKHTITLTATDSSGNVKTASLEITVVDSFSWEKVINKLGDEVARSIQQTSDGGYIVAGSTAAADTYCYIVKLDRIGNIVWDRTFPASGDGEANSVQQTSDGGYIMGGYAMADDGSSDFYVVKLDSNGNLEWAYTYGTGNNEVANSIQQTTDGGYVVAGYTEGDFDEGSDIYVVRLYDSGDVMWDETYDSGGNEDAHSIQQAADGGFIIAGSSDSEGELHGFLLKIDQGSFKERSISFPGMGGYTQILSIQKTDDGGYIAAGYSSGIDNNNFDSYVVKLDEYGNELWHKTFGRPQGDEEAASVQQIQEGGYIIAGYTISVGSGGRDYYIIKLDADGKKVIWEQIFGSGEDEEAKSIYQTTDGGYIVAGTRTVGGNGDMYLIKLEADGTLSTIGN